MEKRGDLAMKYLVWDFDGTLAYRKGMWASALLGVLREHMPGHEADLDVFRPHLRDQFPWHAPDVVHLELDTPQKWWDALDPVFERAFEAIGIEKAQSRFMAEQIRRVYADPRHWRLYDDAIPTLDLLSSRDWTHLILSNHVPELEDIIASLKLDGYIAKVFNSAESGYEKPNPRAFDGVLKAVSGAEAVWMVGDSMDADVVGAETVGIPAILVRRRGDARYCCENLSEVAEIVEERQ